MCGICGIYPKNNSKTLSQEQIAKMISVMNHRGPDEAGIYIDDHVGLGHARLSIIDLSSGTQPIYNEDKTKWIIFNGEIFNYPELREELIEEGHIFYTTSDTEVILHLYESRGPDCLNYLNGQFAICIWDSEKKELFLARDRVGIRPLYYTEQNGSFYFASEIKSIFSNEEINREIDHQALDQIFTFWTTLSGKTVFRNIKELPPGHFLLLNNNSMRIERYWDIPFSEPDEHIHATPELVEKIQELLLDAVKIRLRADVPVGSYLSGGLDSSGVTALIKKNFNNQLHTFGIRFEEKDFDEGEFQDLMVQSLKTDHTEVKATNRKIGDHFRDVLWHCEKPLLRTSPIPLFLLSDTVNKNNYKVVLTGEGADEVFAGYNIFRESKVRQFWAREPESNFRPLLLAKLYPYILNDPKLKFTLKSFFGDKLDQPDDPFFSHTIRWKNTSKIKTFFSNGLKDSNTGVDGFETLAEQLPEDFNKWDYLSKAQYLEMSIFLSNYLLSSQGDRVAMAHSLEIRVPYLDYRIIELMGRVSASSKMTGMNEKSLLKKVFKNVLPDVVANRPKHPYRAPIKQSLLTGRKDIVGELCSEHNLKKSGLFDHNKVNKLIAKLTKFERASEFDNMALIGIASSQVIYDQFISNFPYRSIPSIPIKIKVDRRTK
jgi:asparagine synthase (glutamine-hydrolysing)